MKLEFSASCYDLKVLVNAVGIHERVYKYIGSC